MHLDFQAVNGNESLIEPSSLKLAELIAGLNSLHDGPAYVNRLLAYGPAAIPVLRGFLMESAPSGIYEPRQCAIRALAGLGAYDVLLEYLRLNPRVDDPVIKHGEEAVQNPAARELAACQTDDVFGALFNLLKLKCLPGVVEAIAPFHRLETTPYLIQCLEDDVCRQSALGALEDLGERSTALLVESACRPDPPPPEWETPSSVRRRQCLLQLLQNVHLSAEEVQQLAPLLTHSDPEIVILAARIATQSKQFPDQAALLFHLRTIENRVPWWLRDEFITLKSQLALK